MSLLRSTIFTQTFRFFDIFSGFFCSQDAQKKGKGALRFFYISEQNREFSFLYICVCIFAIFSSLLSPVIVWLFYNGGQSIFSHECQSYRALTTTRAKIKRLLTENKITRAFKNRQILKPVTGH